MQRVRRDHLVAELGLGVVGEARRSPVDHLLRVQDQRAPVDELAGVPDVAEEVHALQRRDHRFAQGRELLQAPHVGEIRARQHDRERDAHVAELIGAAREERAAGARAVEGSAPCGEFPEEPGVGA